MTGSQTHQLGLRLRFTCEKDLTSNGTSTVSASPTNRCRPNHAIPGFSLRAMWPTSNHHFLPFWPLASVCVISRFSVRIFSVTGLLTCKHLQYQWLLYVLQVGCYVQNKNWLLNYNSDGKSTRGHLHVICQWGQTAGQWACTMLNRDRLKPSWLCRHRLTFTRHMFLPRPTADLKGGL